MKKVLLWLIKNIFSVEIESKANFNQKKLMVVANYNSILDGFLLYCSLPINPVFVVQNTVLKKWYYRLMLKFVDNLVINIDDPLAMKKVVDVINSGKPIVIFPEGKVTATGKLMKLYNGTAFVASKTGAEIIPVWLSGTINSKFSKTKLLPKKFFPIIKIFFGENANISLDESDDIDLKRTKANEIMRRLLQKSMFEAQPKDTLYSRFLKVMDLYGKNHKILEDKEQLENKLLPALSYKEILKRSFALGRIVEKQSKERDIVGVLLPNVSVAPSLILGLNIFNRTPALLNYTIGTNGLKSACETGKIKIILTSKKFLEIIKLENLEKELVDVKVIYLEDLKKSFTIKDKLWLMLYAMNNPKDFIDKQNPEDPAVVLFTSGSESKPKGVVLSHRALLANIDQVKTLFDINPTDRVLNAMPLFHSFGLTGGTLLPLFSGTPVILYPSPLHYKIIPEVSYDKDCTVIFGTNTFLSRYAKHAHPYDFAKMRYVVAGAEKLTDEVRLKWMEQFGIRIFEGYGATECAPVIAVNSPIACKFGTVGQFMPGIDYKLKAVDGVDNGGELHIKGPNLMSGYILDKEPGIIKFPENEYGEGWYNTGDIVEVSDDGFISLKGRLKRFVKLAGEMVPLDVVEKIAFISYPDNSHATVIKRNVDGSEGVVLFTTVKEISSEKLSKTAKNLGYTNLMVARDIRYLDNIPLLGTGKTDYVSLGKLANN